MEEIYLAQAPNPEDWPVLIEKLKDLDAQRLAGLKTTFAPFLPQRF